MEFEDHISFSQEWGGKLEKECFSTIRGQDKLFQDQGIVMIRPPLTSKLRQFKAKVITTYFLRICELCKEDIEHDIGMKFNTQEEATDCFTELLFGWWGDKPWWNGMYTVVQKVVLEKKE